MKQVLFVFLGGGLGSIARYGLNKLYAAYHFTFPFATLTANFLSCLIFGFVMGLFMGKDSHTDQKLLLLTGFCGGFSTFSAFAFETNHLATTSHSGMALANIILNFALSIAALYLGGWLTKMAF